MELIDKSALVAEIRKRIAQWGGMYTDYYNGQIKAYSNMLSLLNTFEAKDVDLEKEVHKYVQNHFTIDKEQLNRFGIEEKDYMYSMDESDMLSMAKYFYELGLKSREG